jgi:hypothetical protein
VLGQRFVILALVCTVDPACTRDADAQTTGSCAADLAAIRAVRNGPQPCTQSQDCTVWRNGLYWDACPREVNVRTAARLDAMRAAFEARGCRVETNAACAPQAIRGCVHGTCGGF